MDRIWIESMNSFEIQCITEGLQIDNACLSTKIQSQKNKKKIYIWKTDISLASEIVSSTSCAHFDMQWSRLGIWGM